MWPFDLFKQKETKEAKAPELAEIRFGFEDGMYQYTPAKDVTPHEVSLLLPLFVNPFWRLDYEGWVEKHNLRRHFTKVKDGN